MDFLRPPSEFPLTQYVRIQSSSMRRQGDAGEGEEGAVGRKLRGACDLCTMRNSALHPAAFLGAWALSAMSHNPQPKTCQHPD